MLDDWAVVDVRPVLHPLASGREVAMVTRSMLEIMLIERYTQRRGLVDVQVVPKVHPVPPSGGVQLARSAAHAILNEDPN